MKTWPTSCSTQVSGWGQGMLHLQKENLTKPHQNLKPLQYGPYIITQDVGKNAFELSIPPFLFLHLVFNVELLGPYFVSSTRHIECS